MCCRYWTDESPGLREIVEELNKSPLVSKWERTTVITTFGEVRPTDVVPVIAFSRSGKRSVFPMKWGFKGKTLLMNARIETASVKAMFKEACVSHRCVIPGSYYFEWEHVVGNDGKQRVGDKYMIKPKGSEIAWLCGLYRIEEGMPVFVVLTREPGEDLRFLHDRMPLMLPDKYVDDWINPNSNPEEIAKVALTEMVYKKAEEKGGGDEAVQMSMLNYNKSERNPIPRSFPSYLSFKMGRRIETDKPFSTL
ncbi:MAG: SOS response-associated peptidase family protein [Clostridia bacterium]|nr:SOS response-associated peptidase family protein [Clostridia bacterium]